MNENKQANCPDCGCKVSAAGFICIPCANKRLNGDKQAEPVALEKLLAELLKATYSGKESYYNDEQISDACHAKAFEIALVAQRKGIQLYTHPAPAVAVDHSGLIKRIDAAIDRVTQGRGLMSIPADPRSDVDLVLSECKALLQGENPPFWATDFHPAVAVNEQMLNALKMVMDDPESLEGRPRTFECVVEAIAAAEAAKGGV